MSWETCQVKGVVFLHVLVTQAAEVPRAGPAGRLSLPPAARGSPLSLALHGLGCVSLPALLSLCGEGSVQRHCLSCGPSQDALQEDYNQKGVFPGQQFKPARRPWTLLNFLFWATVLLSPLFSFVLGVFASGSPLLILTFLGFVGAGKRGAWSHSSGTGSPVSLLRHPGWRRSQHPGRQHRAGVRQGLAGLREQALAALAAAAAGSTGTGRRGTRGAEGGVGVGLPARLPPRGPPSSDVPRGSV